MNYIIYKHTFSNGKSYIGFTNLTMEKRLHKHYTNAMSGIDTKFYRAIRKYGMDDIISGIITYAGTQDEAYDLEEYYIGYFDTYKKGYNSTKRGGGGWIIGQLSEEKQKAYFEKLREATKLDRNPNYSGYTDYEIAIAGADCYKKNNDIFTINSWYSYCNEHGYPKSFSKNRFNGESFSGFKKMIASYLNLDKLNSYVVTESHKNKLFKTQKEKIWVTDGELILRVNRNEEDYYINKGWVRGRGLKTKKK